MSSSRFTVTLSSLDSIQQAIRSASRNAGDAADSVVSLSTCDNNRGWEHNAEIARENIEKARKMLASVSPDLGNLAGQVGQRKALLQNLIQNPFVSGAFGSSDPLFVGLLSHSIYNDPFYNPNRPPRPPKKKKGGGFWSVAADLSGYNDLKAAATGRDPKSGKKLSPGSRLLHLGMGIPVGPGKLFKGVRVIKGGEDAAKVRRAVRAGAGENRSLGKRVQYPHSRRLEFGGYTVIQRDGLINPIRTDRLGRTNTERMRKGLAPLGPDGKSVNLHHAGQVEGGNLVEVTASAHQRYNKALHGHNRGPSKIDRKAFGRLRRNYWKQRSEDFE